MYNMGLALDVAACVLSATLFFFRWEMHLRIPPMKPTVDEVYRMRWTISMNENVMRAYYSAVVGRRGGTGEIGYRAVMHREFLLLEPNLTVTEQILADRVQYI
ncbi:unnamed protein product [Euphydryas editha]|uniref:Uncharacterized protein n=1 Tax=Euphydryas editha TaxID=104508 RepID=A0AAU9TY22_EUPED|nr:unnamed protein product [Euphydryas editha]